MNTVMSMGMAIMTKRIMSTILTPTRRIVRSRRSSQSSALHR